MTAFGFALRFARRELRSGLAGFRIFLASLTLGVAAIAGVGSLGQSFLTGLSLRGQMLLGGDIGLERQYRPADAKERALFASYGRVAEFARLRSMATDPHNATNRTLIELKAVSPAYPLLGTMALAPAMPLTAALACDPQCGAAVEDALLARLNLKIGDALHIGDSDFIIRARIVTEPDRVAGGFELGPHVMISEAALRGAGLVVPGSLIQYNYRVSFASPATTAGQFRAALERRYPQAGWRVRDSSNAIPRVTRFVQQATMFLTLVGLAALIVGGVGAGQAVEAYLERRRATIATLKSIGASGGQIFLIYLTQVMAVALLGLAAGLAAGAALPFLVAYGFGSEIPVPAHYAVYPGPLVLAALFGLLAALAFAVPPLARAREIAPAGLFRDMVAPSARRARLPYRVASVGALAGIAALSIALSAYPLFNLGFLGGAAGVLILLRLGAAVLRAGLRRLPHRHSQLLRLALATLTRPGAPATAVIVALGLGLTLLATVALIHGTVAAQVEDELPQKVPSFFFVDIQDNELAAFKKLVTGFPSAQDFQSVPMLRGRIVRLNGVPVQDAKIAAGSRWAVNGDRNVTYAATPPKDSRVIAGPAWWPADYSGPPLVSFDADLARGMGLKIGDTITINVLGRDIALKIFNLRDIDFRTGGINFVLVASPGPLDKAPHTYLASVRADNVDEARMFAALARAFPNISVISVKDALTQLGAMLAQLAEAIGIASLITIVSGVLVLAGAIAAGHEARLYEAVVLKVLGATRAQLAAVYAVEYGVLGALAGGAALVASTLASWAVARYVLDLPLVFAPAVLVVTVIGGGLATLVIGLAGGFAALSAKPAQRLRNS
jgi:putative ABC transport system permease protein